MCFWRERMGRIGANKKQRSTISSKLHIKQALRLFCFTTLQVVKKMVIPCRNLVISRINSVRMSAKRYCFSRRMSTRLVSGVRKIRAARSTLATIICLWIGTVPHKGLDKELMYFLVRATPERRVREHAEPMSLRMCAIMAGYV